ncbi:hypothetical protein OC709_00980 ['Planchonia careya' phytoplasma]|nr:hypothetical protein ['Planchonia careya' phytoplasma]MDO8030090.1 hypothetical protein ['Planchonia careya' phytoplasma]
MHDLFEEIKKLQIKNEKVLVTTISINFSEDLSFYLKKMGIKVIFYIVKSSFTTFTNFTKLCMGNIQGKVIIYADNITDATMKIAISEKPIDDELFNKNIIKNIMLILKIINKKININNFKKIIKRFYEGNQS